MPLLNPAKIIFVLQTSGFSCNSYLIKGKTNALIDSGSASVIPEHISMLKELNLVPEDINLILHTHGHYDHFQADKIYVNAKNLMSEFDAKHLAEENPEFTRTRNTDYFYPKINSFLKENQLIKLNNFNLKVIFSPGHTKGSVCFFEPEKKFLFSGDTVFHRTIGRTDLVSGSFEEIKNSVKKLSELETEFLFPGHGKLVLGKKENKENFEFIKENFF